MGRSNKRHRNICHACGQEFEAKQRGTKYCYDEICIARRRTKQEAERRKRRKADVGSRTS